MLRCQNAYIAKNMVLVDVRWDGTFPLGSWPVEALLEQARVSVDHSLIQQWVLHHRPLLAATFPRRTRLAELRWRREVTFTKVTRQRYLPDRAVPTTGQTIDGLRIEEHAGRPARRVCTQVMPHRVRSQHTTSDGGELMRITRGRRAMP